MPELVVVVPSRGRPHTVAELAAAFRETCELPDTGLVFAVDESDPTWPEYERAVEVEPPGRDERPMVAAMCAPTSTMVEALNFAALRLLDHFGAGIDAVGFFGDDHRPRSASWDRAYLDALAARPGIVYGNDLLQRENLPTQCAMSTSWVRALGHMAPTLLVHLFVDDYWLRLGRAADGLTYLPDVVVEHVHPIAGEVAWDEGHRRVNQPAMYDRDRASFAYYWWHYGERDVAAVRGLVSRA